MKKINFKDSLPSFLILSEGETEKEINNLDPNEGKEIIIKTKVIPAENLPKNKKVICQVNTAESWSGSENDRDTSQFCIQLEKVKAAILPPTGPKEGLLISLATLMILGITGQLAFSFIKNHQRGVKK